MCTKLERVLSSRVLAQQAGDCSIPPHPHPHTHRTKKYINTTAHKGSNYLQETLNRI